MHKPVQRRSFAPHSIIYFGVTVTTPMKTARLCARCWCWLLGFSGSALLELFFHEKGTFVTAVIS